MKRIINIIKVTLFLCLLFCTTTTKAQTGYVLNMTAATKASPCDKVQLAWDFKVTSSSTPTDVSIIVTIDPKLTVTGTPTTLAPFTMLLISPGKYEVKSITPITGAMPGHIMVDVEVANSGDYTSCKAINTAEMFLNGSATSVSIANADLTLTASNQWKVTKRAAGMVNCNTVRYQVEINSPVCGATRLYNATLTENLTGGGVIQQTNIPGGTGSVFSLGTLVNGTTYNYYIDVFYPTSVAGSIVTNTVTLAGKNPNLCPPAPVTTATPDFTFTTPATSYTIADFANVYAPTINKTLLDPNRNNSPGCQNAYVIKFVNTGTSSLSNLVIEDVFPGDKLNILAGISSSASFSSIQLNSVAIPMPYATYSNSGLSAGNIFTFEFVGTTLLPGDALTITIPFEVKPSVSIGTIVTNSYCAVTGTISTAYLTNLCTGADLPIPTFNKLCPTPFNFKVETEAPRPIINKQLISGSSFQPGDPIGFRICVSNYGGAPFTANVSDFIDPAVLDNINPADIVVYYKYDATSPCQYDPLLTLPAGTITFNPTTHKLTGNFSVPAQCDLNKYANIVIEYKTKIKNDARPCIYKNEALLNVTSPSVIPTKTATANYSVRIAALLTLKKEVDTDMDGIPDTKVCYPGQLVRYFITMENISPVPLSNIKVYDNIPHIGDVNIDGGSPRGSTINTQFATLPAVSATGNTISSIRYFNSDLSFSLNAAICPAASGGSASASASSKAIEINLANPLAPGATAVVTYNAEIAANSPSGTACNNAYICSELNYPGASPVTCLVNPTFNPSLLPTETPKVCIQVVKNEIQCCKQNKFEFNTITSNVSYKSASLVKWDGSMNVKYSGLPVQRLRVSIVDLEISYPDAACAKNYSSYQTLANLFKPSSSPAVGSLPMSMTSPTSYLPYNPSFPVRELIYEGTTPQNFAAGQNINLQVWLPSLVQVKCCEATVKLVIKFSFTDINCNTCDFYETVYVALTP